LLGGRADRMVSNMVEVQFSMNGDWEFGAAMSFLVLLPTIPIYLLYTRFMRLEGLHAEGGAPMTLGVQPQGPDATRPTLDSSRPSHPPRSFRRFGTPDLSRTWWGSVSWEARVTLGVLLFGGLGTFLAYRSYQMPPLFIGLFFAGAGATLLVALVLARLSH